MLRASRRKPNFVLLLLDTLRADRLSAYGYHRPTSPRLEAIAAEGVLFENPIACAPWTLPSHASLFTGLLPSGHGATDVSLRLDEGTPTLAELLAAEGYRTVAFSPRNGWLCESTGVMRGFQLHVGPEDAAVAAALSGGNAAGTSSADDLSPESAQIAGFADYCLQRLAEGEAPLFLFLHSMINHEPYHPSAESWQRVGIPPPSRRLTRYLQREFKVYRARPELITEEQAHALNALYDAAVATADELCWQIFSLVERHLGWDNTVFVVTSDHGQNLGEHGMFSHWLCLYDTLLRVPLVLHPARGVRPGTRVGPAVQLSDVFHTLLDLAGHAPNSGDARAHSRRSLLARAAGRAPFDTRLFAEHSHPVMTLRQIRRHNPGFRDPELESPKKAVRTSRYKYVRHGTGSEFLYDLHEDPGETTDVARGDGRVRDELREALAERVGPFEDSPPGAEPEEELGDAVLARLQDLGYC